LFLLATSAKIFNQSPKGCPLNANKFRVPSGSPVITSFVANSFNNPTTIFALAYAPSVLFRYNTNPLIKPVARLVPEDPDVVLPPPTTE